MYQKALLVSTWLTDGSAKEEEQIAKLKCYPLTEEVALAFNKYHILIIILKRKKQWGMFFSFSFSLSLLQDFKNIL